MHAAPPKAVEKIVGFLIPPASREEVLGDLYERCTSTSQYILDALMVLPMVILSRIRRTADSQVLLVEALALYLSYMGAAWFQDRAFLYEDLGYLRLAIPAVMILLGVMLEDAYANPGRRSLLKSMRGLVLGLGVASLSQIVLLAWGGQEDRALALPPWIMLYGSAICLLLASAVRVLFPPLTDRPVGAGGPAFWLKQAAAPSGIASIATDVIKSAGLLVVAAFLGARMGDPSLVRHLIILSGVLLVARELRRRD
jgi:hypothetical protein